MEGGEYIKRLEVTERKEEETKVRGERKEARERER